MLSKIWFYTKKCFWILFVLAALIFIAKSIRDKNKKKTDIQGKLDELNRIANKTEADKREIDRLEKEAKKVEQEVVDIQKKYEEKLRKLNEKPPESKPGDVGHSSDDLNSVWS